MSKGDPCELSKPCVDVGFFTNNCAAMLAFWCDRIGLPCEDAVEFNDGLTQYRHALADSVVKINTARGGVGQAPTGYRELLIARSDITAPQYLHDPDGNAITLVPSGYAGVTGLGIRVAVSDRARQARFYRDSLGFEAVSESLFRCGNSTLLLDSDPACERGGHWVNAGARYFTVHVMRIDEAFDHMTARGAEIGERPYSIGRIARISFVRDPDGNWIEVAQRAAIAGPWWEDE